MKKKNYLLGILMLVFAATALGQAQTPDPNFHIYLAFGQSNMAGNKWNGSIPAQYTSGDGITTRFQHLTSDNGRGILWRTAIPPLARNDSGLSPADYFGRTLAAAAPENVRIGIIVVAVEGAAIEGFQKIADGGNNPYYTSQASWMKNIAAQYNTNPYQRLLDRAKEAQKVGVIKGIIMHQGESGPHDGSWGRKVKDIYNNLLADLELPANSIPFLAGNAYGSATQNGNDTINSLTNAGNLDAKFPADHPNAGKNVAYVISSSGCEHGGDNLHFSYEGYKLLGQRYGQKMLELVPFVEMTGFALTTSIAPAASGSVALDTEMPAEGYEEGTVVTATAVPADGWMFSGWSGDVTGNQNPTTVTMDAHKNIVANFLPTTDGPNLIQNGNFSSASNWQYNVGSSYGGGQGVFSASDNQATLTVTAQGANIYSPQLVQHGIPLEKGYKYRFEMDAWAESDRTFQVVFQRGSDPWTTYAEKSFDLTTTAQKITHEFEMTEDSDPGIQLSFNTGLGQQGNNTAPTIYLKNATLYYLGFPTGMNKIDKKSSNLRVSIQSNAAVKVNFTATENGKTDIKLYSINGNLVASAKLQTFAGENCSYTFDQGILPSGFYVVQVRSNGSVEQAKVVIN